MINKFLQIFSLLFLLSFSGHLLAQQTNDNTTIPSGMVKQGNIDMQVANYNIARNQIDSILSKWDSFIASEEESNFTTKKVSKMTIRIPNDNYDKVVNALKTIASNINSKNVRLIDISVQYKELIKKIETKEQVKLKFLELVRKSKLVDEIDRAQEKLKDVNANIEAMKNQLAEISKTNLGVLDVELFQQMVVHKTTTNEAPMDLSKGKMQDMLLTFFLLVIPTALIVFGVTFYYTRRKRKKKSRNIARQTDSPW